MDFFDCSNNQVSYLDNLVVTKYVDDSKVATTYTVKYQNAGGDDLKDAAVYDTYVGDTYTASTLDMAAFYNGDESKKYVYKSGNTSSEATSTAASNVITLVFDEYDKIAYTVIAKNGEETLVTLASGEAYADGSTPEYWSKYIKVDDQWYETSSPYGTAISKATTNVAYTAYAANDIYDVIECENTTYKSAGDAAGADYSNGKSVLLYQDNSMATKSKIVAGTYDFSVYNTVRRSNEDQLKLQYSTDGSDWTDITTLTFPSNDGTTQTATRVVIAEDSYVRFLDVKSQNSCHYYDYILVKKTPESVSATITSAGYATYCSPYALDFSEVSGLKAYIITGTESGNTLALSAVKEVPANTGVLLEGEVGNYDIPVVASSSTDVSANKLVGVTAKKEIAAEAGYVLMDEDAGVGFYKNNKAFTVGANTAYLPANFAGGAAREAYFFDGATDVEAVEAASEAVAKEGKFIVDGKLRIFSKGKMFNANGQLVK